MDPIGYVICRIEPSTTHFRMDEAGNITQLAPTTPAPPAPEVPIVTAAPTAYQIRLLSALQAKAERGEIYMGTVDPKVVTRTRAKNRVARRSRRINRLRDCK